MNVMKKFNINKDDSILFVVDVQDRLSKAIYNEVEFKKNCKILLDLSEIFEIPVIFTEQNPKSLGKTNETLSNFNGKHKVFEKMEFNGISKNVKNFIKENNKKNIIIVGIEAHVCVYQTVRDLLDKEFNVFVISDATGSRSEKNHLNGLNLMNNMGAVITNTETVLFDILETADNEHFKEVQKLIK